MGVTLGIWGTQCGMPHLRDVMTFLGGYVVKQRINIPQAGRVRNEDGMRIDDRLHHRIEKFISVFLAATKKFNGDHLNES